MRPGQRYAQATQQAAQRLRQQQKVHNAMVKRQLDAVRNNLQIKLLLLTDTDECVETLALLGWVLGAAASVQVNITRDRNSDPLLRRLHTAIQQIQAMCLSGYRWQPVLAQAMDSAVQEAHEVLWANPQLFFKLLPEAQYFSDRIASRSVTPGDIVGDEIYEAQP